MLVVIKGAGDIATGIALRLYRARMDIVMTEIARPTAIRRSICFSEAVMQGAALVEDVEALLAEDVHAARGILSRGRIAVLVDPEASCIHALKPDAVVDAVLAKTNLGTSITHAPVVIGVGPGFSAGEDCHAVVETQRGHNLGRVITCGPAAPNTGMPGNVGGYAKERVMRAPAAGVFHAALPIGAIVRAGDAIGDVDGTPVRTEIGGVLRGILPGGMRVTPGFKCGDVDPREVVEHCYSASDKATAVGGGVLEAILRLTPHTHIALRQEEHHGTTCKAD